MIEILEENREILSRYRLKGFSYLGGLLVETGNAIELKGVTKRFGDVIANDNVNLTVRKGEILSILGENGSGKTTLMNMLSGIYFPDEGEIYVDGKEVTIRSPKDSFALGIGMIHQHFKLINILTAAENIILGLPGKEKLNMKQVEKEIRELTEQYGFDLNPSQKIYDMSVSQKQTVEIVKVLYRGADILILDEPTNDLDISTLCILEDYLDTAGIPDPDLLIRTCNEQRISNFLLWQLAYTEFYFTPVPWPDFTKEELMKAVEAYNHRDRRYGGLKEE
jgi:undecaprenyl diphosphate synthase